MARTIDRMTTDELLDLLQWCRDRDAYRRTCSMHPTGEDTAAKYAALDELGKRLYRSNMGGVARND